MPACPVHPASQQRWAGLPAPGCLQARLLPRWLHALCLPAAAAAAAAAAGADTDTVAAAASALWCMLSAHCAAAATDARVAPTAQQRGPARPVLVLADAHEGHFTPEQERFHLKALEYAFLESQLGAGQGSGRGRGSGTD